MNRSLTVIRALAKWCLLLLLTECGLTAAQPEANTPVVSTGPNNDTAQRLSLAEAQQAAFKRNWDLLAAKTGIDLAAAQLLVAKEFPNPTFSFSSARIDPRGNGTPLGNGLWDRSYDSIFAISQLVEIAGKRHSRQTSGRAGITGARARFFDARRSLGQGITKAYVAALLAEENARVLKESARSLRREADIAETRFNAGDLSDSDRKQIENSADVFELQANSAEAASTQARISVEILMGVTDPKGRWVPQDSLDQLTVAAGEPHPDTGARPDILAAEADLSKAQAELRLQKALRIPDPSFSLFYERNPPGPPGPDTMGVGVSFPLPLWNHNGGNIRAAEAAKEQSALTLGKIEAQARAELANAETAYAESRQRSAVYQAQIRPRASKVREAVAFAYEKGGASLVDLLTAERDDNAIRLATAQALADAANAAADLKSARNVLSETQLNSIQ